MNIRTSFSTVFAIGSFSIGTLLFLTFQITKEESLLFIGLYYVLLAIFCNSLILVYLLSELFTNTKKEETLIKILILLSNIPITYLYFNLTINKF